jgi:hypothetical protein
LDAHIIENNDLNEDED